MSKQIMVFQLLAVAGLAYLAGEAYKRYATPQQKQKWENFAKMHYGEAGLLTTGAGILTRSPNLTASGIGLMLHDRKDYKKWFTGDKRS